MSDQRMQACQDTATIGMSMQKVEVIHAPLMSREFVVGPFLFRFSLWPHAAHTGISPSTHLKNRLAALRTEHGLTARELAAALHLSPATFQALEAGTYAPSLQLALRISSYFSLPVEAIFSLS
jgi:putative transcriptional regulator